MLLVFSPALAQDEEPASVKLPFGLELTPTVDIGVTHDDNIASSASGRESSMMLSGSPSLEVTGDNGVFSISGLLDIERGNYLDSSSDNYTDILFDLNANLDLNADNSIGAGHQVDFGHEDRGTGYSQGIGNLLSEPDTFVRRDSFFVYERGNIDSRAALSLTGGSESFDFDGGLRTRIRDRRANYGSARLDFRLSAKSAIFTELNLRNTNYAYTPLGVESLSSRDTDFLFGLTWENTANTSATVRVGRGRRSFDSDAREDVSSPRWGLDLTWLPKSYSTIEVTSDRSAQETLGGGNYAEVTSHSAGWIHEWTSRIGTDIRFTRTDWEYQGSRRYDKRDGYDIGAFYQLRRWVSVTAGYARTSQDSNLSLRDFDRNLTYLQFNLTL